MSLGERRKVVTVRIRGARITCTSCGRAVEQVSLFEPGRPLCADCLDGRAGGQARRRSGTRRRGAHARP